MNEKEVKELNSAIRDLVELQGDKVGLRTDDCVAFKKSHENCSGCQYELGCHKLVRIMLSTFTPDKQRELIDSILTAKTVDEVRAIPLPEPFWQELYQ